MTKYIVGILLFMWTFGGRIIVPMFGPTDSGPKIVRTPDIVGDIEQPPYSRPMRGRK